MKYTQNKLKTETEFDLTPHKLNYKVKDRSRSVSFSVSYADIPQTLDYFVEENLWLRNVGYIWLVLGVLQTIWTYAQDKAFMLSIWFFIGAICVAVHHFRKIHYTLLPTDRGNILIIKDKDHDTILSSLLEARKRQLYDWYGAINFDNDVDREIEKFRWLESENVIDRAEMEQKIDQLRRGAGQLGGPTAEPTLLN